MIKENPLQKTESLRLNRTIKAPKIRLIDAEGKQVGIVPIEEAWRLAAEKELDLVEISPSAQPPVCKIMDYGKFKYQQSKKAHDAKRKQTVIHVKEIKLRIKTEDHDLDFKLKNARKFLSEGNKVKFTMVFRGREIIHADLAKPVFEKVVTGISDLGLIEQQPRLEGRQMVLITTPKKGTGSIHPAPKPGLQKQTQQQGEAAGSPAWKSQQDQIATPQPPVTAQVSDDNAPVPPQGGNGIKEQ